MATMRAIVNVGRGLLEMRQQPKPDPGAGQVRIQTAACAICATDLKLISGSARVGFPAVPGHEWSGTVDAVGPGVDPALEGTRVVGENVLSDGGEVGFEHPGGYGEYFLTEAANLYAIPATLDSTVAALIEPLAVCVHGVRRLPHPVPAPALVFGDGAIGLLMLVLLRRAGAPAVTVVGGRQGRLALAQTLGAAAVYDHRDLGMPLGPAVLAQCGGPFPTIVEASGAPIALAAAVTAAAREGRVVVMGDYEEAQAAFVWNDLLHRELSLIGSNASAGAWPEAVSLAGSGAVDLRPLVTDVVPATEFARAMTVVRAERDDTVKVVLDWRA